MKRRAYRSLLLSTVAALGLSLAAGCEGAGGGRPASGGPLDGLDRDEALAEFEAVARASLSGAGGGWDRLAGIAEDFLRRFPRDAEEPRIRQHLGFALCALHDGDRAIRELEMVTAAAHPGTPFRNDTLYSLGLAEVQVGRDREARETFEALVREAPESTNAKHAAQELRDLGWIGRRAPTGAELASGTAVALAFVLRGRPRDAALPSSARVIELSDWMDPRVAAWRFPALPRVYVLDRDGIVRAAGVLGPAVDAALSRAREPCRSP